jgi:hypothetical protein
MCYDFKPFFGESIKRLLIYIGVFLQVFLFSYAIGQSGIKTEGLKIASPAFENGGEIPKK